MSTLNVSSDFGDEGSHSIECQNAVSRLMVETRTFLDGLNLIPRSNSPADAILLGLLSKSIVLAEAIVVLVCNGNHDEAFGLCRTCIEIQLTVRYLTNVDTAARCDRYLGYFARNTTDWAKLYRKYYPNHALKQRPDLVELEKSAAEYRSPHKWHEEGGIKDFASEPDTFERSPDGSPINESFSYEILYKWMSYYVHATVTSIEPAHITMPGDRFRVHPESEESPQVDKLALMFSFQAVQLNLFRVMRYFNMTFPDKLRSQYQAVVTLFQSAPDRVVTPVER